MNGDVNNKMLMKMNRLSAIITDRLGYSNYILIDAGQPEKQEYIFTYASSHNDVRIHMYNMILQLQSAGLIEHPVDSNRILSVLSKLKPGVQPPAFLKNRGVSVTMDADNESTQMRVTLNPKNTAQHNTLLLDTAVATAESNYSRLKGVKVLTDDWVQKIARDARNTENKDIALVRQYLRVKIQDILGLHAPCEIESRTRKEFGVPVTQFSYMYNSVLDTTQPAIWERLNNRLSDIFDESLHFITDGRMPFVYCVVEGEASELLELIKQHDPKTLEAVEAQTGKLGGHPRSS